MSDHETDVETVADQIHDSWCACLEVEGSRDTLDSDREAARTVLAWLATPEGRQAAARAMGAKYREDEGWGRLTRGIDDPLLVMCPGERHTRWVIQSPWTEAQP